MRRFIYAYVDWWKSILSIYAWHIRDSSDGSWRAEYLTLEYIGPPILGYKFARMAFGTQKSSVGPEDRGNYEVGKESNHGTLPLRSGGLRDISLRCIN